jgi:hypothetical protein
MTHEGLIDVSECKVKVLDDPRLDFDGDVFIERFGTDGKVYVRVRRE